MGFPILKLLTPKIVNGILDYVFKENNLDTQMAAMIKEVGVLKKKITKLEKRRK
tara:strand:+ start:3152 stop:3313 length:162 start_codon:yes stop_codon:yes gene_type:complete